MDSLGTAGPGLASLEHSGLGSCSPGTTATLPKALQELHLVPVYVAPQKLCLPKGAGMLRPKPGAAPAGSAPCREPHVAPEGPKTTALPQQPHEVKTTLPLATSASPAARIPVHKARAACAVLPLLQLLFPAQQTVLHALSYQMLQNATEERPGIP